MSIIGKQYYTQNAYCYCCRAHQVLWE